MRAARLLAAVAVACGLGLPAGTAAAADPTDLIEVAPRSIEVAVPAPGHTSTWAITVTDTPTTAGSAVPLWLAVTGADGPVLRGAHPLRLTVTDERGTVVVSSSDLGPLIGTQIPLEDLRGTTTLTATVELPREAGDEYRGAGGHLVLTVTAQAPPPEPAGPATPGGSKRPPAPPGSDPLAWTGVEPVALLLASAALLGLGATILAGRRRRRVAATASPLSPHSPEEDR